MEVPTSGSVIVTVEFKAKHGQKGRLDDFLRSLADASRAEDGCEAYFVLESQGRKGRHLLFMKWRDQKAYEAHMRTPLVKALDGHLPLEVLSEPYALTRWRHLG